MADHPARPLSAAAAGSRDDDSAAAAAARSGRSSSATESDDGADRDLASAVDSSSAVVAVEDIVIPDVPPGAAAAFTPPQLAELEQQSMIYRYMAARVPVPTHLIFPIWKTVTGASPEGAQKYPTLMGLATLCLDFGKAPEPEPGRCRRTDGKKWRCWRNAVQNEKYCERHMHRGRKRPPQQLTEAGLEANATRPRLGAGPKPENRPGEGGSGNSSTAPVPLPTVPAVAAAAAPAALPSTT